MIHEVNHARTRNQVRLCRAGEWHTLLIDDVLPTNQLSFLAYLKAARRSLCLDIPSYAIYMPFLPNLPQSYAPISLRCKSAAYHEAHVHVSEIVLDAFLLFHPSFSPRSDWFLSKFICAPLSSD